MRLLRLMLVVLGAGLLTGCGDDSPVSPASARVLISNLQGDSLSSVALDSSQLNVAAVGFTMPATSYRLSSVSLKLSSFAPLTDLAVQLCTDSLGYPGHALQTLANPSTTGPFSVDVLTFTPHGRLDLDAGASYWIVAYFHGARVTIPIVGTVWPHWVHGDSVTVPAGLATHLGSKFDHRMPQPPIADASWICQYAVYGSRI